MTTSANPALVAAAPSLIAVLQAIQQFNSDMGTNPAAWPANFPGAQLKLTGTVALALPQLEVAEAGALMTEVNSKIGSLITSLQGLSSSSTTPPPTGTAA